MNTRFILNDQRIETEESPGLVLLDFIRNRRRLMGTKIGCREGDCGACTVLVGEIDGRGELEYRSMTSCLMPLGNANGKHVVTVEGLNLTDLNPVQHAVVEEGGTQCGFCTVGFVVSLCGFCLGADSATNAGAIAAIDGNICRCTGYKSLERAAQRITGALERRPEEHRLAWLADNGFIPGYFPGIPPRLKNLNIDHDQNGDIAGPTPVGGGTDLFVQKPEVMVDAPLQLLFDHPDLRELRVFGDRFRVGGAVTTQKVQESPEMNAFFPRLKDHMKLVSSTPIRNMATVAGNLVNASPIGDLTIFFLALDAVLELVGKDSRRELPLSDFYHGYKQLDLRSGEHVEALVFDVPGEGTRFNFEKVCKRTHLDIASVNSAMRVDVEGDRMTRVSISAGGVAPVPKFLERTSTFLSGKEISEEVIRTAAEVAQTEVTPISDARGSRGYKRLLLRQLLFAHFLECFPDRIRMEALV